MYLRPEHEARRSEWIEAVREAFLVSGGVPDPAYDANSKC
jgi:hypothetical protein